MDLREQIIFAFNNLYADFLVAAKNSDELIKKRLKKNYRVIDRKTDRHLLDFWRSCKDHEGALDAVFADQPEGGPALEDAPFLDVSVAAGMTARDLLAAGADPDVVVMHLRVLTSVARVFDEMNDILTVDVEEETPDGSEAAANRETDLEGLSQVLSAFLEAVAHSQTGQAGGAEALRAVVDVDLRDAFLSTVRSIEACHVKSHGELMKNLCEPGNEPDPESIIDMLQNSVLGDIAQEIAGEIDMSNLEAAAQNQDMGKIMSEIMNNGFMQKVTNKLSSKIGTGKYEESKLMEEATKLFGSMGMRP